MHTRMRRAVAPVTRARGCKRSIRPERARDEDLRIFLKLSKASRRALSEEIDQLIRPA